MGRVAYLKYNSDISSFLDKKRFNDNSKTRTYF